MTNTFLKKYWIILTSLCTVGASIALACAFDEGPEYGTSSFTPEVFVDSAYSPFFYSGQFYYGINHDEAHITRWNSANVRDWTTWLGKTLSEAQVGYLLDSADAATLDSAKAWFLSKPNYRPVHLSGVTANMPLVRFVRYLTYAKKCEAFALNPIQQAWEIDSTKPKPHFNATTLNQQLSTELTSASDLFLQERYWFQLVRSHFFNSSPANTTGMFDSYSAKFPHNKLWYRCLAYNAGAYYKEKQYSKANYYYSRVFDSCDELKTVAHYSFHPQEEADWQATLALCRTAEEKATLWQMLGIFYSDPQRAIARIYDLDPHSDKMELLLSRAINTYEQQGVPTERENKSAPGARDSLLNLVIHIATAGNTTKPWIWQLAAGYLNTLNRHYTAAAAYYKKAEALVPKNHGPQAQLRLLKMLNTLAGAPAIDHALEQKLLSDIQWLASDQSNSGIRCNYAYDWLKRTMAAKYLLAGDKVRSECFLTTSAFYKDDHNVEALKAFLAKSGKTPYEELCARLSTNQRADLFEYQAVRFCLSDKIDEALAAIKELPSAATTVLKGNPFNARILDCHDCDHEAAQKIKYNKLSLLEKLKELKDKIAAGTDVYTNALLMGNAQYNITQYGNARLFYEGKVLGSDHSMPESIDSAFRPLLMTMTTATRYYTIALGAAQTDEQRAKCQYLLAKCQRNDWYTGTIFSKDSETYNGPSFIGWDGFKSLKQYSNTQYYKEVVKECGYFRDYIRQNK